MPFIKTLMPQFRDSDPDGLIGLKGCMRSFQDIHTWFMHDLNKGNDVLPEQYGAAWVYTRMHLLLEHKIDYTGDMILTTWMEPYRQPVLVNLDLIIEQNGHAAAKGRLECCLFSLTRRRPLRLGDVDFPDDVPEIIPNDIPAFIRLPKSAEGLDERYQKIVRVSDLDKSRHMNNLRYIEMFEDAYDSAFWAAHPPREMEISFHSQCMEGEALSVRTGIEDDGVRMAALHADGSVASVAIFKF